MICAREGPIIRQAGSAFEGDLGKKYAVGVKKVVDSCKAGLIDDVFGGAGGESGSVSRRHVAFFRWLRWQGEPLTTALDSIGRVEVLEDTDEEA